MDFHFIPKAYPDKYGTKMFENDCFIDLLGGKLCLSFLLAVVSKKIFASYEFPDKNQKPLRMCRMQIIEQVMDILHQFLVLGKGRTRQREISWIPCHHI